MRGFQSEHNENFDTGLPIVCPRVNYDRYTIEQPNNNWIDEKLGESNVTYTYVSTILRR